MNQKNPTIKAESANLKGFLIEYKTTNEKSWLSKLVASDVKSYNFSNLYYGMEYQFRILSSYDGEKDTLPSEYIKLKTEPMELPHIKKVCRFFRLYQFEICKIEHSLTHFKPMFHSRVHEKIRKALVL